MLVGLLLMMHESPFPLQAMLRSESHARWIQRSFQTTLPAGGRGSIGSSLLSPALPPLPSPPCPPLSLPSSHPPPLPSSLPPPPALLPCPPPHPPPPAVLGAVTKLRHRRMLATLEGKQLRTSSWASYRVCEVAAVSTGNRSNLPHPGLWAPKQGLKR